MATHGHADNQTGRDRAKVIRKRLFVLCDGTWQDGVNKTRPLTNVATIARCIAPMDEDGCLQMIYYDGGVGNSTGFLSQKIDGATGRGISAKIRNAYSFLSHNFNFDPDHGRGWDEIVLIGFSRGAFAVQCLAAFISDTGGLLAKQHLYYLRGIFTLWAHRNMPAGQVKFAKERGLLEDAGLIHKVTITACAVWDTVSSLGTWFQFRLRPLSFVGTTLPSCVRNAFHALALDEKRGSFSPVLWEKKENPKEETDSGARVSQCWFLGSHSDVGGNGDAALGALTLLWMIGKLHDHVGVVFDESEIAKHLKHKFLEWDFQVDKLRKTFKETRTLSKRKHSGQPTPPAWYWGIFGWRPRRRDIRSPWLLQPKVQSESQLENRRFTPLLSEIHFTVRLAMADGRNSPNLLKHWATSWTRHPATTRSIHMQWCAPQSSARTSRDNTTAVLSEHDLDEEGEEYNLLSRWSRGELQSGPTDRTTFSQQQLEKAVQEEGSDNALTTLAKLLEDHMVFNEDGKLAVKMVYPRTQAPVENETTSS